MRGAWVSPGTSREHREDVLTQRVLNLGPVAIRYAAGLFAAALFASAPGPAGPAAFGQGASSGEVHFPTVAQGNPLTLSGHLYRPDGPGPFPAMVLLHACGGLAPFNLAYGEWLSRSGYVALVVNSFSARHETNICGSENNPTPRDVAGDAIGALAYLRGQAFVDGSHVGVLGWSYGGMATLLLSSQAFIEAAQPQGDRFQAAVALYPDCRFLAADTTRPLLLLLAGADTWNPPGGCETVADALQRLDRPVEWHVYPGAFHAFDEADFGNRTYIALGRYLMRYDPAVAADARARILSFLTKYLR